MKTAKIIAVRPVHYLCGALVNLAVFGVSPMHGQTLEQYQKNHQIQIDSTLNQLKEKDGLAYLSLAPSINYSPELGFSVGVNVNSLVSYFQQKRRNKIESEKLKAQLMEALKIKVDAAKQNEVELLNEADLLLFELKILKERFELYKLNYLQYQKNEITFSKYTQSKIAYLENWKNTFSKLNALELKLSKFNNEFGYFPTTTDSIMKTAKAYEIKD